jgi:hypothetical protein
MPRRTLQDALNSRIPEAVNLPPSDPRVVQYINLGQERMLKRGHWWGTMPRFNIQVTQGLITMPPELASIERVALAGAIIPVHDFWYEWLDNGWGPVDETAPDGRQTCEYRGHYPVFSDVVPPNKQIRLVCDLPVDVGKTALVQGYDDSTPPNWIRTQIGSSGLFQSGEQLTLQQSVQASNSYHYWSKITDVQLPTDMQGQCWLYEYDFLANVSRLIGQYNAGNARPSFARYFFPSVLPNTSQPTVMECLAKLDFIPVVQPTDYLTIGNLPALKLACMAIKAEEELRLSDASLLMNGGVNAKTGLRVVGAIDELNFELDHYLGQGRKIGMNIQGFNFGQLDEVPVWL